MSSVNVNVTICEDWLPRAEISVPMYYDVSNRVHYSMTVSSAAFSLSDVSFVSTAELVTSSPYWKYDAPAQPFQRRVSNDPIKNHNKFRDPLKHQKHRFPSLTGYSDGLYHFDKNQMDKFLFLYKKIQYGMSLLGYKIDVLHVAFYIGYSNTYQRPPFFSCINILQIYRCKIENVFIYIFKKFLILKFKLYIIENMSIVKKFA